jgi:outer membrane protein assembly factor BamB
MPNFRHLFFDMKHLITTCLLFTSVASQAQTLEKIWETGPIVAVPESILPDTKKGVLYVSLIDGAPWAKDNKGGIARLRSDGTGYDSTWITGLHAPKGMGLYRKRLYVADMDEVVVINAKKGRIEKRIAVPQAENLNDITISEKGIVYVSDSKTAKIYRLDDDVPSLYLENMQGVNGLRAVGDDLWIASGKDFMKADAAKNLTKLAELPQGGDGVEPIGNGDFLVSAWSGYIFYVAADGKVTTLLETHANKSNTADIGYDAKKRIMYVPTFFAKTVAAYQLK